MLTTIHNEAETWAAAAVSGGLTETELKAWNDHVAICPTCKEIHEEELFMSKLIQKTLHSECPDPGFEWRIISKFRQAHTKKGRRRNELFHFIPVLAGGAACVALVALLEIGSPVKGKGEKPALISSATQGIDLQAYPPAVRQTIQANSNGRTVSNIERTEDGRGISYEITTKATDGEEWDLTVAEDGTLLSIDTLLTELPPAVQAAINNQVGNGTLEGVEKLFDGGETTYRAGITSANDHARNYIFTESGTLLSKEVNLAELSPTVQTAIGTQVGQGKLEGIDKTFEDGEIAYDATSTTPTGQERDFTISEEGNLLSREVSLKEVPAAVRQTIWQTLGKGKVVEIDQTFVADNQVMPYEVEGQKDGRLFDFMISPTGHFLGTEE